MQVQFRTQEMRDVFVQHPAMERFVKRELGYPFFNNQWDAIVYDGASIEDTPLLEKICENPRRFYLEVLQNMSGVKCHLVVNKGDKYFNGSESGILEYNTMSHIVEFSTGEFDVFRERVDDLEKLNSIIESQWKMDFDIAIRL